MSELNLYLRLNHTVQGCGWDQHAAACVECLPPLLQFFMVNIWRQCVFDTSLFNTIRIGFYWLHWAVKYWRKKCFVLIVCSFFKQDILNDIRNKENVPYQRMSFVESASGTSVARGTPNQSSSSPASFIGTPNQFNTSSLSYSGTPNKMLTNVRPLGQAYRMAQADSEVINEVQVFH